MKTSLISAGMVSAGIILGGCARAGTLSAPDKYRVYFGTETSGPGQGIFQSTLDMETGRLGGATLAGEAVRPGFLAIHPGGKYLYAVCETNDLRGKSTGVVSAFEIDPATGNLKPLNTQPVGGNGPCHLIVDPAGRNVLTAQYNDGSCSVLPLNTDGTLRPCSDIHRHSGGSGIVPNRQNAPHAHSINLDAAGRMAVVADLGLDRILIYRFDPESGTLVPNDPPFVSTEPGGGPRHFIFHPSGIFAYANLELSSQVAAFRYDAARGALAPIQTLSTLPANYTGINATAEIRTTPDGRFVYVSNRGHNSIAMYAVDGENGELTPLGFEPTRGEIPRNFNLDPSGTYLVVAHQKSGNATVFKIDRQTGLLAFTGSEIAAPGAICVRFLPITP